LNGLKSLAYCVVVFTNTVLAAGYQIFPTLTYENAATLNATKKYTVILGATDIKVDMTYVGSVDTLSGTAASDTNILLPYLRVAGRINPQWVVAFDISHPVLSNIQFPADSIVSAVAIDDIIHDTNYSPKLSYQLKNNLALGVGFDINHISDAEINFGAPKDGKMTNKTTGLNYGWDVGLAWQINNHNFLNLSYYSKINFSKLTGYSQQGNVYNANFSDNLIIPATWTVNLIHTPIESWTFIETFRFIQWNAERDLTLVNSAVGDIFFPLFYNNSWAIQIAARYQFLEKWGAALAVEYDSNPQSIAFRPIALPATDTTLVGAALDYAMTAQWTAKLQYAFIFAKPGINQAGPPVQLGHVTIGVNVIDFGLSWKI
jgi:long-subunit fatty acid transport protein